MPRIQRKRSNPLKTIGAAILAALMLAALILAVPTLDLYGRVRHEMSLTPTPVPVMQNVMHVTPDPNQATPEPIYKNGSTGPEVEKMQQRLLDLGFYDGAIDGQYGPGTQSAVTAFQRQHGLDTDGVAGPQTREVLYSSSANRAVETPTPSPEPPPAATPTQDPNLPLIISKAYPIGDNYQAPDLVLLTHVCDPNTMTIKYDDTLGNREAAQALQTMLAAAHKDGITVWQVSAGYRTLQMQQQLFDAQVNDYMRSNKLKKEDAISATKLTVAVPGTSEHHTGLAFDITVPGVSFKGTEQARWLAAHCWDYGFIIRYTEDKQDITGFLAEPWHIRYVGTAHATVMRDQGLALEEYIQMKQGN